MFNPPPLLEPRPFEARVADFVDGKRAHWPTVADELVPMQRASKIPLHPLFLTVRGAPLVERILRRMLERSADAKGQTEAFFVFAVALIGSAHALHAAASDDDSLRFAVGTAAGLLSVAAVAAAVGGLWARGHKRPTRKAAVAVALAFAVLGFTSLQPSLPPSLSDAGETHPDPTPLIQWMTARQPTHPSVLTPPHSILAASFHSILNLRFASTLPLVVAAHALHAVGSIFSFSTPSLYFQTASLSALALAIALFSSRAAEAKLRRAGVAHLLAAKEAASTRDVINALLPADVAARMEAGGGAIVADEVADVSVLFLGSPRGRVGEG
jgi:hypothetical protein